MSGCQVTGTGPPHLCGKDEERLRRYGTKPWRRKSTGGGKVRSWPGKSAGRYSGSMAVRVQPRLDAARLRADFPIFEQTFHGKPLAYLNSAATSQKPRQVLDAMTEFYETSYSNVHRGVYTLGERATAGLEGAREKVRAFVNAPTEREIIFVRNATEALNLVAYAYGLARLKPGDVVLATQLEHHSNFVPWQYVANRTGAEFRIIPIDGDGDPLLDEVADLENVKVVAANVVSNSLGTIADTRRLAAWTHERGAILTCDAAQAA